MALSASFSIGFPPPLPKLCYSGLSNWKQRRVEFQRPNIRKGKFSWIVKSVVNRERFDGISDNGATEPARVLLERLFAETQKLEERIGRDPDSPQVSELGLNLGKLESDLLAVLFALKKKEEDLQDAERKISRERNEMYRAKKGLEHRETEMEMARLRQEKLEEELRQVHMDLVSQAAEISELKLRLKERDQEISATRLALSVKTEEIGKIENEWMKKSEEAANAVSELRSRARLLDEANKIVEKQEIELGHIQRAVKQKEEELEGYKIMRASEAEKLKVAEAKLEKQTMYWVIAQEELKRLEDEKAQHAIEANETREEFERVRKLLSDVRSELVSSQNAFSLSREKMEGQEQLLEKQLAELEEQRGAVASYMTILRDAMLEVESERVKLRVTEAQNDELQRDLSMQKEHVVELRKELDKGRSTLKEAFEELTALREVLGHKNAEFEEKQVLLMAKESELAHARQEIQHLKSEQESLKLILKERDLELSCANNMLEEVNQEISKLKQVLLGKEDELSRAMSILKDKEEHVQIMHHEINLSKLKFSEAETMVERIVDLTNEMVLSSKKPSPLGQINDTLSSSLIDGPGDSFNWPKKQIEAELDFARESLKTMEMEVLAARTALTLKDEELNMVLRKMNARDEEIKTLKGEVMRVQDDLKQLYASAQATIGEKSVGELVTEKLQLEAAQLQVDAATSAMHKITEMSRQLLNNLGLNVEDGYTDLSKHIVSGTTISMINDPECSGEIKEEVFRLLTLTERLVREARIANDTSQ
ncbi:protein involved in starch initiation 1 [Primulina tabacum]|uniref:protein involved in starch initiation 1 n=1 Tax=Primulina tabacum TaxID=48773 RepID=UPI003F5A8E78